MPAYVVDKAEGASRLADLQKNLRKNLGLKCKNKAQGLGEVLISIEGVN